MTTPRFLLIDEAAAIARTSPNTIRYWIQSGRLRSARPGRRRLIAERDLLALLNDDAAPGTRRRESAMTAPLLDSISVREAARVAHVSTSTIRRWIARGALAPISRNPIRLSERAVLAIVTVPAELARVRRLPPPTRLNERQLHLPY